MQKVFMGFGKAIEYIENIGIENIEKYLKQLTKYTINILKENYEKFEGGTLNSASIYGLRKSD